MSVGESFASGGFSAPGSTASSLIDELRGDSPAGWARFVALYTPLVYRWARRAGVGPNDAADVVQDVFQGVAGQIARFRRDKPGDSFRGWLFTITRNKVSDHFRRQQGQAVAIGGSDMQQRLAEVADPAGDFSDQSSGQVAPPDDRALLMWRAADELRGDFSPATWTAFWRLAVEGQPAAEIARDLGLTEKAVRQAKYRVLQRLRERLAELES